MNDIQALNWQKRDLERQLDLKAEEYVWYIKTREYLVKKARTIEEKINLQVLDFSQILCEYATIENQILAIDNEKRRLLRKSQITAKIRGF